MKKQFDFRNKYKDPRLSFFIGDVREYNSVLDVMENVDYVLQLHLNRFHHANFILWKL